VSYKRVLGKCETGKTPLKAIAMEQNVILRDETKAGRVEEGGIHDKHQDRENE